MASTQDYNQIGTTPYTPPAMPDVAPVAVPSPLPTENPQANGAVQKSGGIATIADGLLRGFMQGRAMGEAKKVMEFKKKDDNLQASYNNDAARVWYLNEAKTDPKSPEYQQAVAAVNGSWGALQDFRGQQIQQMGGKKKGKSKEPQKPPQAILADPHSSPQEKAEAIYAVSKASPPPVLAQLAVQRARQAQMEADPGYQASQLHNQNQLSREQAQQVYNKYAGMPEEQFKKLSPEVQQQFANAEAVLRPSAKITGKGEFDEQRSAIAKKITDDPTYQPTESEKLVLAGGKSPTGTNPKVGTFGGYLATYAKDNNKKVEDLTTDDYDYARKKYAWDAAHSTTSSTSSVKTDPDTGQQVRSSSTNTRSAGPEPTPPKGNVAIPSPKGDVTPNATPRPVAARAPATTSSVPLASPKGESKADETYANWAKQLHSGDASLSQVPSKMRSGVLDYMDKHDLKMGRKETSAEQNSEDAMKDVAPIIKQTMKMLEPMKDEGGMLDSFKQKGKYMLYKHGVDTGPLQDAINQYTAFVKIAGASPWSKVGRGKFIFEAIQEHLPDPSKDSPGLMYTKLKDLQDIFATQQEAVDDRRGRGETSEGDKDQDKLVDELVNKHAPK